MIDSKKNFGEIIQPPPRIFSVSAKNINDIEQINSLEYITINFNPVQNGNFNISLKGTSFGSITQWYTDCPFGFISIPKIRLDKVTIRFVSEGAMRRRNSRAEYLASAGNAMLVKFEEMVTEEASSGFKGFAGTVDWSTLLDAHVALEGTDEIGFPELDSIVQVNTPALRAFRYNFESIYKAINTGLFEDDFGFALFKEMIIYQFLASWPKVTGSKSCKVTPRPSWRIRRAMEYIDANLHRRISLAEVAAASNFGVRSLQASFKNEIGKSPAKWILERRLSRAHAELVQISDSWVPVAEIARRWGFSHMGDFARRYKEKYGETPQKSRRSA